MTSKIIAVIGATGNQGGSVVNTFLQEPGWQVRGITRNTTSAKAQALQSRGVDVVQADLDDVQSLRSAFDGVHTIFLVSDTWGLYGNPDNKDKPKAGQPLNIWAAETETQQLKNAIDAAAQVSTLQRLILSSLSDAKKWSKGKYTHVYHFDSKANADYYAQEQYPNLWAKASVYQAGLYLSNFLPDGLAPATLDGDTLTFTTGIHADALVPWIAADEDTGPIVKAMVEEPEAGKVVLGYRENTTFAKFIETFVAATGRKAQYVVRDGDVSELPFPDDLKLEVSDNWKYINEFGYDGGDPAVIHPKDLKNPPVLGSIADYVKTHDWKI